MNFAKRLCADDANLIEVVEINVDKDEAQSKIVNEILKANCFESMYRKQIEEMSANGTVGAYIRVENADVYENGDVLGGKVRINYCNALNIIPLTVINNEIIECAFTGSSIVDGVESIALVTSTLKGGKYTSTNVLFNKSGKVMSEESIPLGEVKPFAIMRVAEVNNLGMRGYGFPKLWSAIPNLKLLDLSYTMWKRDLEKSDKIVLINDVLCKHDGEGKLVKPTAEMKKIFVQVGKNEKLPEENALWQEYNPTVRIGEVTQSLELALSLLSMSFGFGTKRYTFEQGRILTATEYAGERQDSMQEINKQRAESKQYINDLVNAIRWFYNSQNKSALIEQELLINFDDSYVEDTKSTLDAMRNDSLSFDVPQIKVKYFMKMYNITEQEAKAWANVMTIDDIDEDTTPMDGADETKVKETAQEITGKSLNGAQTQSLLGIIAQYTSKALTESQAIKIISVAIGISNNEAKELLKA